MAQSPGDIPAKKGAQQKTDQNQPEKNQAELAQALFMLRVSLRSKKSFVFFLPPIASELSTFRPLARVLIDKNSLLSCSISVVRKLNTRMRPGRTPRRRETRFLRHHLLRRGALQRAAADCRRIFKLCLLLGPSRR